jgi:uroporphyrin-III C-methyltransferase
MSNPDSPESNSASTASTKSDAAPVSEPVFTATSTALPPDAADTGSHIGSHTGADKAAHQPASSSAPASSASSASPTRANIYWLVVLSMLTIGALISVGLMWQKLTVIQEQLARQVADSTSQAVQARTIASDSQDQVRDAAARLAVAESRLNEVTLQRGQLDELIQSVSRSRDENLAVDIESAIRVAQQQFQLTGRTDALIATLKTASQRIERSAQPKLIPVQRAIAKDIQRLSTASVTDIAGLLARIDELMRQVDELPAINGVAPNVAAASTNKKQNLSLTTAQAKTPSAAASPADAAAQPWWKTWPARIGTAVSQEVRNLVRVRRIDNPDAVLMTPEQTYFLRENIKLQLLNARLGLLSHHMRATKADLEAVQKAVSTYFDPASRRTQNALTLLNEAQANIQLVQLPQLDDTFAALSTAAAGR